MPNHMQLRVRRRWAHPILSIAAVILVLIFIPAIFLNFKDPATYGEGIRIMIPPFCLFSYLAVAVALNYRIATVRHDKASRTTERYFSAGVETKQGLQVDVTGPQPTLKMALDRAEDIAGILNTGQHRHTIPAIEAAAKPDDSSVKTRVLIWMAAFIVLVLIGGAWEISSSATNIRYSGPRLW